MIKEKYKNIIRIFVLSIFSSYLILLSFSKIGADVVHTTYHTPSSFFIDFLNNQNGLDRLSGDQYKENVSIDTIGGVLSLENQKQNGYFVTNQ